MSKAETCSCWYVLLDTWYNNIVVFEAYCILRFSENTTGDDTPQDDTPQDDTPQDDTPQDYTCGYFGWTCHQTHNTDTRFLSKYRRQTIRTHGVTSENTVTFIVTDVITLNWTQFLLKDISPKILNKDRRCTCNVILRRVRATIVVVGKQ
jgi:hypothetical protein